MNTRIAAITATVLLAITLTGCGEDTTATDAQPKSLMQEAPSSSGVEATDSGEVQSAEDEAFLKYVDDELLPDTGIADFTDDELIAAGHAACEQVKNGVPFENVRVVEGEEPAKSGYFIDSSTLMNGALYSYCPDLIPDVED